jgi:hypothetical protein
VLCEKKNVRDFMKGKTKEKREKYTVININVISAVVFSL